MANEKRTQVGGEYLYYKDKPLVREGNTICYGDMNESCILILEIMSYVKNDKGEEVPGKILIQVLDSKDPTKIIKQGQKDGLHDAFSMGLIWLERALLAQ